MAPLKPEGFHTVLRMRERGHQDVFYRGSFGVLEKVDSSTGLPSPHVSAKIDLYERKYLKSHVRPTPISQQV